MTAVSESFQLLCFFLNDDRTLVVGSAVLANSMWHNRLATSGAFSERRSNHLPVCSSLISSGLGCFIFWAYRHFRTPPCLLVYAICQTDLIIILMSIIFVNSFLCYFASASVSRAIISSSLVGTTRTFTLESSVVMMVSSPRMLFFSSSMVTPR